MSEIIIGEGAQEKPNIDYKNKKAAIFNDLPEYLKDPKNYHKIQRTLVEALFSGHSHQEVIEWAECKKCQKKFAGKWDIIKKLGFTSIAQFKAWQLVHHRMQSILREPLSKYNKP